MSTRSNAADVQIDQLEFVGIPDSAVILQYKAIRELPDDEISEIYDEISEIYDEIAEKLGFFRF